MKVLLLSNGAPGYHRFFNNLIRLFEADGHEIAIAVDSKFSSDQNQLETFECNVHEFSDYFAEHITNHSLLEKYSEFNLNAALLSDYERSEVYKISSARNNEYYVKLKSSLLSFFERAIVEAGVNLVLYEGVSNAFAHFAYFVCEKNGVAYKGLMASRLPGRFVIIGDPKAEYQAIERTLDGIVYGSIEVAPEIRDWCERYLDDIENIVPDYMSYNRLDDVRILKRYFTVEKLQKVIRIIRHLGDDHHHSFQIGNPLNHSFQMFWRNFCRKLKAKRLTRYFYEPDYEECFFLYPLHFHPESSTSILAGTYLNEYEVIRNIAFNLPEGAVLYVKDHISAFAFPKIDFYKKLASLPNVKLLAPTAPTKKLIKFSRAVITLTSTVGYEALLLNKRVYLFGSVFYEFHPGVIRVVDPTKIFEVLRQGLQEDVYVGREYNVNFLSAYYMWTKPGRLNLMAGESEAAILANEIYPEVCRHVDI